MLSECSEVTLKTSTISLLRHPRDSRPIASAELVVESRAIARSSHDQHWQGVALSMGDPNLAFKRAVKQAEQDEDERMGKVD